jgi:hypothetical protein
MSNNLNKISGEKNNYNRRSGNSNNNNKRLRDKNNYWIRNWNNNRDRYKE